MTEPNVIIAGVGMECSDSLTVRAKNAAESADILIGAGRILRGFEYLRKETFCSYNACEIADFICGKGDKKIVVLMSGDCGFFSGARKLSEELDRRGVKYETIPGIASPVYLCSRLGIGWERLRFVSLHGAEANIVREVCSNEYVFALLGGEKDCGEVCRKLTEYGRGKVTVFIGEELGYPGEKITKGLAEELSGVITSKLCSMLIVNSEYEKYLASGIPDDEFIRGKAPMTKAEVRCSAVSKLCIGENDICWDIGSGTGSVSVEMALRCPRGKVYAVEKDGEAAELSEENFRKFGCDNVISVCGRAENVIKELPAPDCVFIGGSGGVLSEIVSAALSKNPSVRIVMTAVTLETLSESECLGEREIVEITAARTVRAGRYTMLRGENPVFVIRRLSR
ncbi:MAG: precorrin-6y C5,15-methyltransferase (decarboxylating) subunit CbiE [Huintestinicola sp.]|uniref:precorrin-6y C5,15-methyltransferase (decarboxylating) subunit CbiE n=1 Tax=Huintestinicola sp. TaxID=2981661 RepID=UPI003F0BC0F7